MPLFQPSPLMIGKVASGTGRLLVWTTVTFSLLIVATWNLDGPALWWDEGWTLSVARNWVESGHYGRMRDGQKARPGLEASFTTTLPVGAVMRVLGVGIWQGRLFGALCAVATIMFLAAMADRIYNQQVAIATIIVALLLTPHPVVHPFLLGRRVLAEMPMLAYLIIGYFCLWWTLNGRWIALAPATLLLAIAWLSKAQTAPFLLASLIAPMLVALLMRQWRVAGVFALVAAGVITGAPRIAQGVYSRLVDSSLPPDPTTGLIETVAVVIDPGRRIDALQNLMLFGLSALCGILWAAWKLWQERAFAAQGDKNWYIRCTLVALCGSWLAWYLLLSIGWGRYMAPPVIIASLFVAALFSDGTDNFAVRRSLDLLINTLTLRRMTRAGGAALGIAILVTWSGTLTAMSIAPVYFVRDDAAQRVASWLDALPPGTRIETYETELHFLLHQPYTFPPDQVHVALLRRLWGIEADAPITYDPLVNDPDYLVEGGTGVAGLYEPVLASGQFQLVFEDGVYRVFARIR